MPTHEEILQALEHVIDPELGVDIVNLGLVYQIEIDEPAKAVRVEMTLTAPGCPLSEVISQDVTRAVRGLGGVSQVQVDIVWSPPWHPSMLTPVARTRLGLR